MGEAAVHSGGARPVSSVLADLLSALSQEFLRAAQLPVGVAPDAAEGRSGAQSDAVDVLKRLLAAQREASRAEGPATTSTAGAWLNMTPRGPCSPERPDVTWQYTARLILPM